MCILAGSGRLSIPHVSRGNTFELALILLQDSSCNFIHARTVGSEAAKTLDGRGVQTVDVDGVRLVRELAVGAVAMISAAETGRGPACRAAPSRCRRLRGMDRSPAAGS